MNRVTIKTQGAKFNYKTRSFSDYLFNDIDLSVIVEGFGDEEQSLKKIKYSELFNDIIKLAFMGSDLKINELSVSFHEWKNNNSFQKNNIMKSPDRFRADFMTKFINDSNFNSKQLTEFLGVTRKRIEGFMFFIEKYGIPIGVDWAFDNYVEFSEFDYKLSEIFYLYQKLNNVNENGILNENFGYTINSVVSFSYKNGKTDYKHQFNCPFEYIKYQLLLNNLLGTNYIKECPKCKSLFVSFRSDKKTCSQKCRTALCRKNKMESEKNGNTSKKKRNMADRS